jgi:hypothetical protein
VLGSRTLPTASSSEARLGRCSFPDKTPIGADIHRSSDFPAPAMIRREIVTPSNLRLPDGIGCTRSCRPFPAATSLDIGTRTPIPVRPMAYPITCRTASSPSNRASVTFSSRGKASKIVDGAAFPEWPLGPKPNVSIGSFCSTQTVVELTSGMEGPDRPRRGVKCASALTFSPTAGGRRSLQPEDLLP